MKKNSIIAFLASCFLLSSLLACGNAQSAKQAENSFIEKQIDEAVVDMSQYMPKLPVGTVAPDFVANDTCGNAFQLSSLKGSYVVVDFWASWCGDCRREIPVVKELYADFASKDVKFVGLSFDHEAESWRKCLVENEFPFIQLCNFVKWKESPISEAYDLHWIPTMALISPEGTLVGFALTTADMRALLEKTIK